MYLITNEIIKEVNITKHKLNDKIQAVYTILHDPIDVMTKKINIKHLKDDLVQVVNITTERMTSLRQRTDDQTNKIDEIIQTMTKLQIMTEIDGLHADNMQLDLNKKKQRLYLISM